jgi:hypothetical protein
MPEIARQHPDAAYGHVTTVLIRDGRRLARIVPEEDAWIYSPAYRTTAGFDAALAILPREHRKLFTDAVRSHLIPALAAGADRGTTPWPPRLRIHKIGEVYSLTWSFSGPDGRALFIINPDTDGEPLLTWLAIGSRHPGAVTNTWRSSLLSK